MTGISPSDRKFLANRAKVLTEAVATKTELDAALMLFEAACMRGVGREAADAACHEALSRLLAAKSAAVAVERRLYGLDKKEGDF